jgi:hypothetical protein
MSHPILADVHPFKPVTLLPRGRAKGESGFLAGFRERIKGAEIAHHSRCFRTIQIFLQFTQFHH